MSIFYSVNRRRRLAAVSGGGAAVATFGELTLVGAGGVSTTEADGAYGEFTVSGGTLTGNTTPLTVGAATVGDTTVTVVADTYSVVPNAAAAGELADVIALGEATISGKTIAGRGGDQEWVNATLNNQAFTSQVDITSHDNNDRFTFTADDFKELRNPTNLRFHQVDFSWSFVPGVSNSNVGAILLKNVIDGLIVDDCDFDGGLSATIAANGQPFFGSEWSYRGTFGLDGTSDLQGEYKIINSSLHDAWRAVNIPGGAGVFTFEGNDVYSCSVDSGVFAGESPNGRSILFNKFRDPLIVTPPAVEVLSVDTALDQMTADSDRFGASGTVTINMNDTTGTMPGGVDLPGVGGANDYACTIVSVASGQTVLQFPVDITSTGTDVYINVEPDHADMLQGIPSAGADVNGLEVVGNMVYGVPGSDGVWPQGAFFEDIAGSGVPGYYDDSVFAGNVVWTGNAIGISLYNSRRGIIADNTTVCESGTDAGDQSRIRQLTQWTFDGENNVLYNNVANVTSSEVAADLVSGNHDLTPADYATSGIFAGTGGYDPANVAEMLAAFSRTDLDGSIDYTARTYDLPSINEASSFTFTDAVGEDTSTLVTAGPQQITSVTNGQGAASSYGALVSVQGGDSPEFRITSDAGGASVVTDWTSTPAVIEAGEYLWVRDTSSAIVETTTVFVRVGRATDAWSITTAAGFVYSEDFTTDVSAQWTASGSGVLTYDGAADELECDPMAGSFDSMSSPEITVVDGNSYEVVFDARNDDPAGGVSVLLDVIAGTTVNGEQLGASTQRIAQDTTGTITHTFTASGTSMFISLRGRGAWPSGSTFSAINVTVEDVT